VSAVYEALELMPAYVTASPGAPEKQFISSS
jgi:hypothetical protein